MGLGLGVTVEGSQVNESLGGGLGRTLGVGSQWVTSCDFIFLQSKCQALGRWFIVHWSCEVHTLFQVLGATKLHFLSLSRAEGETQET